MPEIKLVLGGEGEEKGVQVNRADVLNPKFKTSRDGTQGLDAVKAGGPVVVCDSDKLPFRTGCADEVSANSVPVDRDTYLGRGYRTDEIKRVKKPQE